MASLDVMATTEQLVGQIDGALNGLGLLKEDIAEIMSMVQQKIKKLRLSMELPGEDARKPFLNQLITEEEEYIESLETIVQKFLTPLRNAMLFDTTKKGWVRKTDIDVIFGNIEEILHFHRILLDRLDNCAQVWPQIPIGGIFVSTIPEMKMYIPYINNFKEAMETLRSSQTSRVFSSFLTKVSPTGSQELEHLLSCPLKRMTQYKLNLKLLLELTPIYDQDNNSIGEALEEIKQLQRLIQQNREQMSKMSSIKNRITGLKENLLMPTRNYIHEGFLTCLDGHKKKDYYYFLFNDILIATKPQHISSGTSTQNQFYRYKKKIPLESAVIREYPSIGEGVTPRNCVQLMVDQKNHTFTTTSARKKEQWIRALDTAINYYRLSRVFGVTLSTLISRENGKGPVPVFLEKTIDHLEKHSLHIEGIFRISASACAIQSIREALDSGVPVDYSCMDHHIVAGLLKLFFRELPEPLIPFQLFSQFVSFQTDANPILRLRELVGQLPEINRNTLIRLCQFFVKVCEHSAVNKMSPSNMATVFGPALLRKGFVDDDEEDQQPLPSPTTTMKPILSPSASGLSSNATPSINTPTLTNLSSPIVIPSSAQTTSQSNLPTSDLSPPTILPDSLASVQTPPLSSSQSLPNNSAKNYFTESLKVNVVVEFLITHYQEILNQNFSAAPSSNANPAALKSSKGPRTPAKLGKSPSGLSPLTFSPSNSTSNLASNLIMRNRRIVKQTNPSFGKGTLDQREFKRHFSPSLSPKRRETISIPNQPQPSSTSSISPIAPSTSPTTPTPLRLSSTSSSLSSTSTNSNTPSTTSTMTTSTSSSSASPSPTSSPTSSPPSSPVLSSLPLPSLPAIPIPSGQGLSPNRGLTSPRDARQKEEIKSGEKKFLLAMQRQRPMLVSGMSDVHLPAREDEFRYPNEDVLWCSDSAISIQSQEGATCFGCQQTIKKSEQGINVLEKDWHQECFTCQVCKKPLHENFVEIGGLPYCPEDYKIVHRAKRASVKSF